MRHLISGIDWAIAGAAMVAAPATPMPVTLIKSRRFIGIPLLGDVSDSLRVEACGQHGTSGSRFPRSSCTDTQKARPSQERPGFRTTTKGVAPILTSQNPDYIFCLTRFLDANRYPPPIKSEGMLRSKTLCQPRVRDRIMKLSKVYSATCHH